MLLNNKIIEESSLNCSGLFYGYGYFTTIKVVNRQVLFYDEHINRLKQSGKFFNLALPSLDFKTQIYKLLYVKNLKNAHVKITVFLNNSQKPSVLITAKNLATKPKSIKLLSVKKQNFAFSKYKSLNYLENILALNQAKAQNFDDVLFTKNNFILETAIANIFFVKESTIITPKVKMPILNGIIRQKLLNAQKIAGFKVIEQNIKLNQIKNFDSAFITNCIKLVCPIKQINNHVFAINNKAISALNGFVLDIKNIGLHQ